MINGVEFDLFDVGGQRNQRRKWIHCFSDVTSVIFVAAISEYDQVLFEDERVNRLEEAIKLYDHICNTSYFEKCPIMLFLNKVDLFEEKIKTVDLRAPADPDRGLPARFQDYTYGACTCGGGYPNTKTCECGVQMKAKAYLRDLFVNQNRHEVHPHITCATDTGNVRRVFDTCRNIILHQSMTGSGFMDCKFSLF
jgi:GTPase SAR1 family protein